MEKILNDSDYLSIFKVYMIQLGAESILYSYNETIEIREKLAHISEFVDEEVRQMIYLHYINAFYDTYLALGAPFKVQIAAATHGDFMRGLTKRRSIELDVFRPIEQDTFECLIREHLDRFLNTPEYRQLVRSGRHSILILANSLKDPVVCPERFCIQGVDKDQQIASRRSSNQSQEVDSENIRELKSFLHSSFDTIFGRYLESHDKLALMHFYQSVYRHQETQFPNEMERNASCTAIFERYVSRNSDDQVKNDSCLSCLLLFITHSFLSHK